MEALNTHLLRFFDWLLWTTIEGSVLVVLIVLIQKLLRRRLPVHWHHLLWLLLLVRLTSPWLPESKISIFNLVPRSAQQGRPIASYSQSRDTRAMEFYLHARPTETQQPEKASVKFVRALPVLWLAGTVLIAGYVCVRSIRLWRTVKRERPITDQRILDLLEDCKMQMRVETIVAVVVSDKIKSPALFGFVRPRLLLPHGMLEAYDLEELRYIFIHELAHLKQRDIYLGWLTALLHVAHWFDPLMWFAFSRIRADREIACDRLAMSTMEPDEPPQYGRTIVSLLESFFRTRYLPSVAGILEDSSQIERRIEMIANYKKTTCARWAGAMLLLAALACIVLTNAYVAEADFMFGTPTNLGPSVNSGFLDFYPNISADGLSLHFVSERKGGSGGRDLWVTTRLTISDDWGAAVNVGQKVNSPERDEGPCMSSDGLELYFFSSRPGGYGDFDLWVARRPTTRDEWGPAANVGLPVNSSAKELSPGLSMDGLSLYFASDRDGGFGGNDIWVTRRSTKNDVWAEPVNLGAGVNSESHDARPSISRDELLLFFGSMRPGPALRNIYVSTRATTDDQWGVARILEQPINNGDQNDYPSLSSDGLYLYFASDRIGSPGGDIWQAPILPAVDLNGDGKVDFFDFRKIAQYWGQNEASCDIAPLPNGDGIVDEKDLNLLAEYLLKELQPIAHWRFDETQGTVAEDSMGINDGTLHSNPTWQPEGGAVGGALKFDGTDDYVSTDFVLDPAEDSFSVFAWIKGGARGQVIISQRDASDGRNTQPGSAWLMADSSYGRLITRLMHPPFDPLLSESVISDSQWHHVGLVYYFDSLHRHLYVDGIEVARNTDAVGGVRSNAGLYFSTGQMLEAGSFLSGLIDDIRIYDEALSADEVADLAK